MLRVLLLLLACCAPLAAVAPAGETTLELESAALDINVDAQHNATVTTRLTVRNPGKAADFTLEMPENLVPEKDRDAFVLLVDEEIRKPERVSRQFTWLAAIDDVVELRWSIASGTTSLPHTHPLGRRELTVRLSHLRTYAKLPALISVGITHSLPPELTDTPFPAQHAAGARVRDLTLTWLASTLGDKRAKLIEVLESFKDKKPGADNRLYTNTLVHAVDLALLAEDHAAVATHCDALAALELDSGRTITHCGPWAQWRRYVPWQLLRLRALEAQGQSAAECAKLAVADMAERWPAYLKAKQAARPFDEFNGYWDYDWQTTRDLYARALEVTGKAEEAAAVRKIED